MPDIETVGVETSSDPGLVITALSRQRDEQANQILRMADAIAGLKVEGQTKAREAELRMRERCREAVLSSAAALVDAAENMQIRRAEIPQRLAAVLGQLQPETTVKWENP